MKSVTPKLIDRVSRMPRLNAKRQGYISRGATRAKVTKPLSVVIDAPLSDSCAKQLCELSPRIQLIGTSGIGKPLARQAIAEAEVIFTSEANFDPAHAPRLRWIQTDSAAIGHVASRPVFRTKVSISNVSGAYSVAVAECAMGMLLGLTRRIRLGFQHQLDHRWPEDSKPFCGEDLYGRTMGIVGYGSIGRHIARMAEVMGMTVLACKRHPVQKRDDSYHLPGMGDPEGDVPKQWFANEDVCDMLRQCDVVVLCLPHTPDTEGLIGRRELASLPPHAYLVNVGRGAVVDEAELIKALEKRAIAGAALDVFCHEPLPKESPFWTLPNVLLMPHVASWTTAQADRAADVLIENLRRDLAGLPLLNVIDKKLMY